MTEMEPETQSQFLSAGQSLPLDSTAELVTRIAAQLGSQLSHVRLNGSRKPMPTTSRPAPARPALVAVAHGSRDPRALRTVTALLDLVRELRPGLDVRLGHIEIDEPALPTTLTELGAGRAVLVPLLLSRGYHVKQDIPAAVADAPGCAPASRGRSARTRCSSRRCTSGSSKPGGTTTHARVAPGESCSPGPGRATPSRPPTPAAPPRC